MMFGSARRQEFTIFDVMTTKNVGLLVKVQLRVVWSLILFISFSCIAISQSDAKSSNFLRRYIDKIFAKKSKFKKRLVVGTYVFSLVVGMTVRDISGKAIANLNYEKINHHAPVFIGDTINAYSKIISKEMSQSNKHNAKIKIMTVGQNQKKEKVLSFYRTILIKK